MINDLRLSPGYYEWRLIDGRDIIYTFADPAEDLYSEYNTKEIVEIFMDAMITDYKDGYNMSDKSNKFIEELLKSKRKYNKIKKMIYKTLHYFYD